MGFKFHMNEFYGLKVSFVGETGLKNSSGGKLGQGRCRQTFRSFFFWLSEWSDGS
jgi:hypothetical protein